MSKTNNKGKGLKKSGLTLSIENKLNSQNQTTSCFNPRMGPSVPKTTRNDKSQKLIIHRKAPSTNFDIMNKKQSLLNVPTTCHFRRASAKIIEGG